LQEKRGDIDLGGGNPLLGGLSKPFGCLPELLGDAVAARIEPPEAELRRSIAGFGSGAVTFCGLDQVRHRGFSSLIHLREAQGRRHEILPRGLAQQRLGGALIARPSVAFQGEQRQIVLGARIALLGGFAEPFCRFADVAIDALTGKVHQPERHLRRGIALLGSFLVPAGGGRKIRLHLMAVGVEDAEAELGSGAALSSGKRVPVASLPIIGLTPDPPRVNQPGIGLCIGDPLLGSRPAPTQSLGRVVRDVEPVREEQRSIVLGSLGVVLGGGTIPSRKARRMRAMAVEMQQAELMLSHRMTLFRRTPVPAGGIGEVGQNPVPAGVQQSQPVRGLRISAGSGCRPFRQRCNVIAAFIRLTAALHCGFRTAQPRIEPGDPLLPGLPPP
jgi:hypothetical protein